MQKIIAECGTTINVPKDHPLLSQGIFLMIDLEENTEIELSFLDFAFSGETETPIDHSRKAFIYGLRDLARGTLLAHIESVDAIPEDLANLFVWYELPDRLAVQLLDKPTSKDLGLVVKLEYQLCYKKFFRKMGIYGYDDLKFSFLDTVVETIGIEKSFFVCCMNGHLELVQYLVSSGVDIRVRDDNAMILAANNGHLGVVQYLVSLGANIRARDDLVIKLSVFRGHTEMMRYLVCLGFSLENCGRIALLHTEMISGDIEVLQYWS